jgi:hypothetical protein
MRQPTCFDIVWRDQDLGRVLQWSLSELDVDLALESIEHAQRYPLKSKL